jgi:predicted nucleic acid-binding protein
VIVLDASALADWLLRTPGLGPAVAGRMRHARFLHTLDFAFVEVVAAVRGKLLRGELSPRRGNEAVSDLLAAPVRRHEAGPLAPRVWALRETLSPYDAAYVALAEVLRMPLVTTDRRLARSHGHVAQVVDASSS